MYNDLFVVVRLHQWNIISYVIMYTSRSIWMILNLSVKPIHSPLIWIDFCYWSKKWLHFLRFCDCGYVTTLGLKINTKILIKDPQWAIFAIDFQLFVIEIEQICCCCLINWRTMIRFRLENLQAIQHDQIKTITNNPAWYAFITSRVHR